MAMQQNKLLVPPQTQLKSEIQPGRSKVVLKPGHSLMDWIRLTKSGKDLTGVRGIPLNITKEELAKHNKKNDAWICIKGNVYNVTSYMAFHPGGEDELMRGVGRDATMLFNEVHRWVNVESMLQKCLVGKMKLKAPYFYFSKGKKKSEAALTNNPSGISYHPCTLLCKETINYNTKLFTFGLPDTETMIVPIGHHVHIRAIVNGSEIKRSYTPVVPSFDIPEDHPSLIEGKKLYLLIKIYPNGVLTPFIDRIEIGGIIDISKCEGNFDKERAFACTKLVLLAAGTGLTPMVKLIYYALCDANTKRIVQLVFFNQKEKDILWHTEMDNVAQTDDRFSVKYVLSEPENNWKGLVGRVSKSLLEGLLPRRDSGVLICICGPTPFTTSCVQYLQEMEYSPSSIHAFIG